VILALLMMLLTAAQLALWLAKAPQTGRPTRLMSYLLLADQHAYVCRSWDALVHKLVWAHGHGDTTAKARRCSPFTDRP
jgi:hypothetical protein